MTAILLTSKYNPVIIIAGVAVFIVLWIAFFVIMSLRSETVRRRRAEYIAEIEEEMNEGGLQFADIDDKDEDIEFINLSDSSKYLSDNRPTQQLKYEDIEEALKEQN